MGEEMGHRPPFWPWFSSLGSNAFVAGHEVLLAKSSTVPRTYLWVQKRKKITMTSELKA